MMHPEVSRLRRQEKVSRRAAPRIARCFESAVTFTASVIEPRSRFPAYRCCC